MVIFLSCIQEILLLWDYPHTYKPVNHIHLTLKCVAFFNNNYVTLLVTMETYVISGRVCSFVTAVHKQISVTELAS